jgi:hypothetical protein
MRLAIRSESGLPLFLCQFASEFQESSLWIDDPCINQTLVFRDCSLAPSTTGDAIDQDLEAAIDDLDMSKGM